MPRSTTLLEGAKLFNAGRFFEAHEAWESDWRESDPPDRPQLQAAILVCGVFVLIEKGRFEPAERLATLALERFAEAAAQGTLLGLKPALEMPEVEQSLLRVLAAFRVGEKNPAYYARFSRGLRVHVRM